MKDSLLNMGDWPHSIREINDLKRELKAEIYFSLIPPSIIENFKVQQGETDRLITNCPADTRAVEMWLFDHPGDRDPVFYLHMADTLNFQIAILLLVINDPSSPRFDTDVSDRGLPTAFGTQRRNVPEEERAMEAGLAPGQVRRGLRLSREALPTFEAFVERTGHNLVIIDPLTYHNAILYERYGFAYFYGRQRMEWIDQVMRPGGELIERFDDSTPFRQKDSWKSIRGRSWAIHDGILDEPFGDIRMYKRVKLHAGINTFPDGVW